MKKIFLSIALVLLAFSSPILAQGTDKNIIPETQNEIVEHSSVNNKVSDSLKTNTAVSKTEETTAPTKVSTPIIPSQGFSIDSLWRGVLGMVSLIFIAFLFSSNRKAINWKIVGIGLAFQLLIAIGVLKVEFIKTIFEFVGGLFVSVLEFTRAGSKFLFEGLVVDMDTFGFIFAFQVLPTIIFFSALTSVLFYLGIIQRVGKRHGICYYLKH